MRKDDFRHSTQLRVRNYEIDWQGVVHNAVYLLYFETGRLSYLEDLGMTVDVHAIKHESKIVIVRNEVNYLAPAMFGEVITVYTRVSSIGNSSFTFEGYLEEAAGYRPVAENICVHVWLDEKTGKPVRVPDEFRRLVRGYEGERVTVRPG